MTIKAKWLWTLAIILAYIAAMFLAQLPLIMANREAARITQENDPRAWFNKWYKASKNPRVAREMEREKDFALQVRLEGLRQTHNLRFLLHLLALGGLIFVWTRDTITIEEGFPDERFEPGQTIRYQTSRMNWNKLPRKAPETPEAESIQRRKKRYWPFITALILLAIGRQFVSELTGSGLIKFYYSLGSVGLLIWLWPWGHDDKSSVDDAEKEDTVTEPETKATRWIRAKDYEDEP